jgi:hypothetical protein
LRFEGTISWRDESVDRRFASIVPETGIRRIFTNKNKYNWQNRLYLSRNKRKWRMLAKKYKDEIE